MISIFTRTRYLCIFLEEILHSMAIIFYSKQSSLNFSRNAEYISNIANDNKLYKLCPKIFLKRAYILSYDCH